jgi:hypothetical protein
MIAARGGIERSSLRDDMMGIANCRHTVIALLQLLRFWRNPLRDSMIEYPRLNI